MVSFRRLVSRGIRWPITPVRKLQTRYYRRNTEDLNISTVHLFFHSLSVDPRLSFAEDSDNTHDFESWFVTVSEFKEILDRLYVRGYCLVDIHDVIRGKVCLPEGKRPLVLSFDDVNYYEYMTRYGFSSRMLLTPDGKIANSYITESGEEIITYEGDCVPIIETFIEKHPDFSHNGARGIIAVTGYKGILGYRQPSEQKDDLLPLISELKHRGWLFASHSWRHSHSAYSDGPVFTYEGRKDVARWVEEVVPYTGSTDIFITPFGIDTRNNPGFDAYIRKCGFKIICPVFDRNQINVTNGTYYYTRISVDGVRFSYNPHALYPYIGNPYSLLSPFRTRKYYDASLTADGLANHARSFLESDTFYQEGSIGTPLKYSGKTLCFDDVGLLKHYTMGGRGKYRYVKAMDFGRETLFAMSSCKGSINCLPEIPGLCLYMVGHVGVYDGNGYVIECSRDFEHCGVIRTKITDRPWTHWFHMPWVLYPETDMDV